MIFLVKNYNIRILCLFVTHQIIFLCDICSMDVHFFQISGGRLGVPFIHLFVYICWSYRMVALMLRYNYMAPSTCKADISASAICHLQRFSLLVYRQAYIGFLLLLRCLSCNSSLYFAASWVQSMTRRQLTVRTSVLQ